MRSSERAEAESTLLLALKRVGCHFKHVFAGQGVDYEAMLASYPPEAKLNGGPGTFAISWLLGNPPHLDPFDASRSFAIWVKRGLGLVTSWFFLFPEHGLAIEVCSLPPSMLNTPFSVCCMLTI